MSLEEEVIARAAAQPDSLAISCAEGDLSYRDLDIRSAALAGALRSAGVGPDGVVAVLFGRSPAMIVSALAVLRAGGAYLPMDPSSPQRWILEQLAEAQCGVLIAGPSAKDMGFGASHTLLALDSLGQCASGALPPEGASRNPCPAAPGDLAYVIFTSGSTGRPKGVEIERAGLANLVRWHRDRFRVTASDRATQIARVGFDAAAWEIWPYLAAGASLHLPPDDVIADPGGLRDWIVEREITISFAPTPLAERLISLPWPEATRMRFLLTGADTLQRHPAAGLPFALINNYGPTECTVVATSCEVPAEPSAPRPPLIGKPIANLRAYVLDGSLQPVPAGVPGELYLGGPGVARGYRNRPDLTRERFIQNPLAAPSADRLLRTGDLVLSLPDGQLSFLGRVDEQVKIRGFRVEPGQVAAALNAHPAVAESVVIARNMGTDGKRLVAYLVPKPGAQAHPAALREFLAGYLPDYMVPSAYVGLGALPVTPNGKVDRAGLPEPDESNLLKDKAFAPPGTGTEKIVAEILAPLLGIDAIDVHANFFALGGHSLLGTQLIVRLRKALDIELPLRTVFEAPTVSELSAEIDRRILAKLDGPGGDLIQGMLAPQQ